MAKQAGGVDILLRAQGADETQAELRQTSAALRDLGKAGSEGATGLSETERVIAMTRGKIASLSGIQTAVPGIPASAQLGLQDYGRTADRLGGTVSRLGKEADATGRSLAVMGRVPGMADAAGAANLLSAAVSKVGAAVGGLAAGAVSIYAVGGAFNWIIGEAADAEEAVLRAGAALQATGQYSAAALRQMVEFASSMQKVSTFSDEAALNLAALIARMTGITGEPLERLTRDAIDLQAALGVSGEATARIFAQLQAGETLGLTRLGIRLDETTPKARLLEAGLSAIERTFGGSAAAAIEGYNGSLARMKNAMSDLGEAIGGIFLPALTSGAQGATRALNSLTGAVEAQREMAKLTSTEMIRLIDASLYAAAAGEETTEKALAKIEELKSRAMIEIGLEMSRGSVEEAMRTLDELDERIRRGQTVSPFAGAEEALRDKTARAAEVARALSVSGGIDLGEITVEVRAMLKEGDFQAAEKRLQDLRAYAESHPEFGIDVSDVERAIDEAKRPVDDFLRDLRRKAEEDFRIKIKADTDAAVGSIEAYRRRLEGETVEVLIRGTPDFREASAEMARLREEEERRARETAASLAGTVGGVAIPVAFRGPTETDAAAAVARAETLLGTEPVKLPPMMQAIVAVSGPAPAAPEAAALTVPVKFEAEDPTPELDRAQAEIVERAKAMRADVRIKIQGAEDADELTEILKGLEDELLRAKAAGERGDWGQRQAAEEFRQANLEAKALAGTRLGTLGAEEAIAALRSLTLGLSEAQAQAEKGLPAVPGTAESYRTVAEAARAARDEIQKIADAPTAEAARAQFVQAEKALQAFVEKFPGAKAQVAGLIQELETEVRSDVEVRLSADQAEKQLASLIRFAENLGEAAGTLDLQDRAQLALFGEDASAAALAVDEVTQALDRLRSGTLAAEDLEKTIRVLLATLGQIDSGKLDLGPKLEGEIRSALSKFQGLPGTERSVGQLDRLQEKIDQTAASLEEFPADAMAGVLGGALSSMILDAENFSENMQNVFKGMVDALIRELARLAAYTFVKWLLNLASGGALSWVPAGPSSAASSLAPGGAESATSTIPAPSLKVEPAGPVEPVDVQIPIAVTEPDIPAPAKVKVTVEPDRKTVAVPIAVEEPAAQTVRVPGPEIEVGSPSVAAQEARTRTAEVSARPGAAALLPKPSALAPPPALEDLRLPALTTAIRGLSRGAAPQIPVTSLVAGQVASLRAQDAANLALASSLRQLAPTRSLVESYLPAARTQASRQMSVAISAQDAGSFERWLRTGSGRRALEALSNAGAGL